MTHEMMIKDYIIPLGAGVLGAFATVAVGWMGVSEQSRFNNAVLSEDAVQQRIEEAVAASELRSNVGQVGARLASLEEDVADQGRAVLRVQPSAVRVAALEAQLSQFKDQLSKLKSGNGSRLGFVSPDEVAAVLAEQYRDVIRGPQGPRGQQGLRGADGPAGLAGVRGERGVAGLSGAPGAEGPVGPVGVIGPKGADGRNVDTAKLLAAMNARATGVTTTAQAARVPQAAGQPIVVKKNTCLDVSGKQPIVGVTFESGSYICNGSNPILTMRYYQTTRLRFNFIGQGGQYLRTGDSIPLDVEKSLFFILSELDGETSRMVGSISVR